MSWLAKLIVPNAGVAGLKRTSVDKAVLETNDGWHRNNLLKLPSPNLLPPNQTYEKRQRRITPSTRAIAKGHFFALFAKKGNCALLSRAALC